MGIDLTGWDIKMTMSSAYSERWWSTFPRQTGLRAECCLMLIARGSIAIANRNGLRGQPWCVPLSNDLSWLVNMQEVGWAHNVLIHEINCEPNPYSSNTLHVYCHSNWSNAFSASKRSAATSWHFSYLWYIMFISLLTIKTENLPGINPVWSVWIMVACTDSTCSLII